MRDLDPKLSKLIQQTVKPLVEEDRPGGYDYEEFGEHLNNRLKKHFRAHAAYKHLSLDDSTPSPVLDAIKDHAKMHLKSAKAFWYAHPEHIGHDSFSGTYDQLAGGFMQDQRDGMHHQMKAHENGSHPWIEQEDYE
jgi:hypothetical protein